MIRSSLTVIETTDDPSADLTTVDDYKTEHDITDNADDENIIARITRASNVIAGKCGRTLTLRHVVETFVLSGEDYGASIGLQLSQYPVSEIESVEVDGSTLTADQYEVSTASGLLYRKWCGWGCRIVVTYSGGYDLPEGAPLALVEACMRLVSSIADQTAEDGDVREVSDGDSRVVYFGGTGSAGAAGAGEIDELIAPFRRMF